MPTQRKAAPQRRDVDEEDVPSSPPAKADAEKLKKDLDDILDEIDDVLEENAEQFVKAYVQKGGE